MEIHISGNTRRDDGYSSNSTVSTVSLADLHHDLATRSRSVQEDARSRTSLEVPPSYSEAHRDPGGSVENSCMGRVRDIKTMFEPSKSGKCKKLAPPPPPKPSKEKIKEVRSRKDSKCKTKSPGSKAKLVSRLPKKLFNEIRNKCSGRSKTKPSANVESPSGRVQKSHSEPCICPPQCVRQHRLQAFTRHMHCHLLAITQLVQSTTQLQFLSHTQPATLAALKARLLSDWSALQQRVLPSVQAAREGQGRRSVGEGAEVNPHRPITVNVLC